MPSSPLGPSCLHHGLHLNVLYAWLSPTKAPELRFVIAILVFFTSSLARDARNAIISLLTSSVSSPRFCLHHIVFRRPIYNSHLLFPCFFHRVQRSLLSSPSPAAALRWLFLVSPMRSAAHQPHHLHPRAAFYVVLPSLSLELRRSNLTIVADPPPALPCSHLHHLVRIIVLVPFCHSVASTVTCNSSEPWSANAAVHAVMCLRLINHHLIVFTSMFTL